MMGLHHGGKKNLALQILFFSLPLVASSLLQVLFNMADIAVVGRFSGPLSLAAVGSTSIAVTLFVGVLIGIGGGVNALVAQYYGASNTQQLQRTIHTSALICLMGGLLLTAVGIPGARPLLRLLNTKEELLDKASLYMRIYFCGAPALALYNFGNAVYSAMGNTKKPLVFLLVSGVLNVLLNLFFVIVLHMDVAGVALASIIAEYVSAIAVLASLFRSSEVYSLRVSQLRLHGKNVREILALGIPSGMQNAIFYLANLFIQAGINRFDTVMVAGNSAAVNSDSLVFAVMSAFHTACSSFVGLSYGAGNKARLKQSYLVSTVFASGSGAVFGLLLVLAGPAFLSLFTADPAVVQAGMVRLTIMGCSYWICALMDNAIAGCRGLGKSVIPMVIVISGSCLFRILWVYTIFQWIGTVNSLYLLYPFSWGITALFENWYFLRCYRRV